MEVVSFYDVCWYQFKSGSKGFIIGGALGGISGAVVGGLSGNRRQIEDIDDIDLKITVADPNNPIHTINFITKQFKNGGTITVKEAMKEAEHWQAVIAGVIKNTDEETGIKQTPIIEMKQTLSVPDELIKLNELKEKGILSEEEFQSQKKKLLS
jgi:hypothetical protein